MAPFMSFPQSLLRYSIINFLFFESLLIAGLDATFPELDTFGVNVALLVGGVFVFCGVVFLVPLHPLKQGLHDVLVNTVVVRRGRFDRDLVATLWFRRSARRAWAVAMGVFLLVTALGAVPVSRLAAALDSSSATTAEWRRAIEAGTARARLRRQAVARRRRPGRRPVARRVRLPRRTTVRRTHPTSKSRRAGLPTCWVDGSPTFAPTAP